MTADSPMSRSPRAGARRSLLGHGFTLVELLVTVAILAIVAAAAVPVFQNYIAEANAEANMAKAVRDIRQMQLILDDLYANGSPPPTLAAIGLTGMTDPWGNPYRYLWLRDNPDRSIRGKRRRDRSMNPVNFDYDLYSMGEDGETSAQFLARKARDDVVRANGGYFIGLAADH